MQQSNASNFNVLNLGGGAEFKKNVQSILSLINTGELVEVTAVEDSGVSPVGFVSVKPLTLRNDGDKTNVEYGEIHNVPYFRLQGGKNAVIIDPQVGDIGWCGFCSRDISLVKRIRAMAAQNVTRHSDISDAVFFGGWSSETPEQYIYFEEKNIRVKAKSTVIIDSPESEFLGNVLIRKRLDVLGIIRGHTLVYDNYGSMSDMRVVYNGHTHIGGGAGNPTQPPDKEMPQP